MLNWQENRDDSYKLIFQGASVDAGARQLGQFREGILFKKRQHQQKAQSLLNMLEREGRRGEGILNALVSGN